MSIRKIIYNNNSINSELTITKSALKENEFLIRYESAKLNGKDKIPILTKGCKDITLNLFKKGMRVPAKRKMIANILIAMNGVI